MRSRLPHLILGLFMGLSISAEGQRTPEYVDGQKQRILQQERVSSVAFSEERQTPSFIAVKPGTVPKHEAQQLLAQFTNVRSGIDELRPERIVATESGFEVLEYRQYYKGIPVEHARYTAMVRMGSVHFFNGAWFDVPAGLAVQPVLTEARGIERAKGAVNAKKYAWEQVQEAIEKTSNAAAKAAFAEELKEYAPKGELVVIKDYRASGVAQMRLAYKYNIYSFEPVSRQWVYVDAHNGDVLLVDKIIKHADEEKTPAPSSVSATVQTRYAGARAIYTRQISGNDPNSGTLLTASNPLESYVPGSLTYGLIDDTRGSGIETYDLNGVGGLPVSIAPSYSLAKSFTDVDNFWTSAEHRRGGTQESENDDIAWDAHWGAGVVYDYWKQKHNRLSFDGKDAKIKSYIHSGVGYDNAFWNGKVMTYGDGSYPAKANGFRPLTSLDVCGHEIGHGVCEFTSDLVYEKESGAMNEGFSDIWAACVEYFAIKTIDAGLGSIYKPFHIGEQIAADPTKPLRRMDNPKAAGDPDTYGGQYWANPVCTPTLANDYCGVHTNSGVLNKWFYLLTVGSGAGSGPDAAFAGQDDGINDLGEIYEVSGLGFDAAENIAYLTELMLTSNATFAEARNVSINIASAISGGACTGLVKSVTNAWYAVNVGEAFTEPCTITYGFIFQPGGHTTEGLNGAGCNSESAVAVPLLLPANSTASIISGGSAVNGQDYRLSTTSLSNAGSTIKQDSVLVYVKNDAVVEGTETVILQVTVTNAGANPVNTNYELQILEDDVIPIITAGSKNLLSESFTGTDGFGDPAGWTEILEVPEEPNGTQAAKGKNQWGVFSNKLAVTGRDELTGVQLPNGTYNNNSLSQTIISSPLLDARGLARLQLKFDFEVQGEIEPNGPDTDSWPALDYMAIVYSFDGATWHELGQAPYARFAAAAPTSGQFDYPLPGFLSNRQFYLGFRWNNDPLIGGPVSVSIDNLTLDGAARKLESDLGHNSRENLGANQDVYYYSIQDGDLVGRVKNNSSRDYGCTNLYVEKAGNGSFNLYQSNKDGLHKVADKVIRVETGLIYKASSTISLYYTEQQLLSLEMATGQDRTSFSIYHVEAAAYTAAGANNTRRYAAVYTPLPGVGGYYTVTLNDRANGSYALGYNVSVIGFGASDSRTGLISAQWKFGDLYPNPASGKAYIEVSAPGEQRIALEIVNSLGQLVQRKHLEIYGGANLVPVELGQLSAGSYMLKLKDADGILLYSQPFLRK